MHQDDVLYQVGMHKEVDEAFKDGLFDLYDGSCGDDQTIAALNLIMSVPDVAWIVVIELMLRRRIAEIEEGPNPKTGAKR